MIHNYKICLINPLTPQSLDNFVPQLPATIDWINCTLATEICGATYWINVLQ